MKQSPVRKGCERWHTDVGLDDHRGGSGTVTLTQYLMKDSHLCHLGRKTSESFLILQDELATVLPFRPSRYHCGLSEKQQLTWVLPELAVRCVHVTQQAKKVEGLDRICLTSPVCNLNRLGQTSQSKHRYDTKKWPWRKHDKRKAPADQVDHARNKLD